MRRLHPRGSWEGPRNPTGQDAGYPLLAPSRGAGLAPTPARPALQPAQLFRGNTSTEPPLPPAIIRGVSPAQVPRPALYTSICYHIAELFFLPMEVGNMVRTGSGEDLSSSHPHPTLTQLLDSGSSSSGDTGGLALAKVCPCLRREVASRVPGSRLSVVSIMSLEMAHNENKFCLIFACVPHFCSIPTVL